MKTSATVLKNEAGVGKLDDDVCDDVELGYQVATGRRVDECTGDDKRRRLSDDHNV